MGHVGNSEQGQHLPGGGVHAADTAATLRHPNEIIRTPHQLPDGVQVGSRFAASLESSSHDNFKQKIIAVKEGDTQLTLKELAPVRLIKNKFYNDVQDLYEKHPSKEDLVQLLGRARAKKGMFEGDLEEGELEIGQIAGLIHEILPVKQIVQEMIADFEFACQEKSKFEF